MLLIVIRKKPQLTNECIADVRHRLGWNQLMRSVAHTNGIAKKPTTVLRREQITSLHNLGQLSMTHPRQSKKEGARMQKQHP